MWLWSFVHWVSVWMGLSRPEVLSFSATQCFYPDYLASIVPVMQDEYAGSHEIIHIEFITFRLILIRCLAYSSILVFPLPLLSSNLLAEIECSVPYSGTTFASRVLLPTGHNDRITCDLGWCPDDRSCFLGPEVPIARVDLSSVAVSLDLTVINFAQERFYSSWLSFLRGGRTDSYIVRCFADLNAKTDLSW